MLPANTLAQRTDSSRLGLFWRLLYGEANQAWTTMVSRFRVPSPAWYELNDRMLRDIGVTHGEAEFEALRRSWSGETLRSVSQSLRSVLPQHIQTP
jgi:hypothetical protein